MTEDTGSVDRRDRMQHLASETRTMAEDQSDERSAALGEAVRGATGASRSVEQAVREIEES